MCDLSLDACEVWDETPRRARKQHVCDSCGGPIKARARYLSHFSVYEGDRRFQKICAKCETARDAFARAHDGLIPTPGYFPELLNECVAEGGESKRRWGPTLRALQRRASPAPEKQSEVAAPITGTAGEPK